MNKKSLTTQETKAEFISSVYKWLMNTLKQNGKEEFQNCFVVEGSSIMCSLPDSYFDMYSIPSGTRIEMKFVAKKG